MLLNLGLILLGLTLLYFGGDMLIAGSVRIASHFKLPPFIIGATILGFGTSAPELCVSLLAALKGASELALGNVVGSNVANIGLVLGLTALVCPLAIEEARLKKEMPPFLIASFILLLLAWNQHIGVTEGIFMVGCLLLYLWKTFTTKEENTIEIEDEGHFFPNAGLPVQVVLIFIGLGLLVGGADLMVRGGVDIARSFGISEWLIGITIIAIGTSLPEIVSSLMSALKGHGEMALGNVFGSNIFNILLVLGGTAIVRPLNIVEAIQPDLLFATLFTIFLLVLIRMEHDLSKRDGILLLVGYVSYVGMKSGGIM